MYLTAFELVRSAVVDGVRGFFTNGWDANGFIVDDDYTTHVLPRAKHELEACLAWLVEMHALTDEEAASVERLRQERNRVAHEIATVLIDPSFGLNIQALTDARVVLKRLAVFFGTINVEIAIRRSMTKTST